MTKLKMIVVWGSEDILSSSIEFFLADQEDWEVINLANDEDLEALLPVVETTQPDIIIINQGSHNVPTDLTLELLLEHPAITLITINLDNNAMEVYNKQRIMVKQASDLVSAIERTLTLSGRLAGLGA